MNNIYQLCQLYLLIKLGWLPIVIVVMDYKRVRNILIMKEFNSFISNIYQIAMEDISELPAWQPEKVLAALKDNPLTIKSLKVKLDKIYMINSYN